MRCLVLLLISFGCTGALSHAQTADELIAKNIEARGGLEKIKAIKTIRATGKIKGFGGRVLSMGEENARPDLVRVTTTVQGMTAIQAYDGTPAGKSNPLAARKIRN